MGDIRASLLGKLPSGDGNGIRGRDLAGDPRRIRIGVVLFDADRRVEKTDDGNEEVRMRIRRIEEVTAPEDATEIRHILERAYETRTGNASLPFELADDEREAFGSLDTERTAITAEPSPVERRVDEPPSCSRCGAPITFEAVSGSWQDIVGEVTCPDGQPHEHAAAPEAPESESEPELFREPVTPDAAAEPPLDADDDREAE